MSKRILCSENVLFTCTFVNNNMLMLINFSPSQVLKSLKFCSLFMSIGVYIQVQGKMF